MSSDICVFLNPGFVVSGTSKINCKSERAPHSSYVINSATTVPISFYFNSDTSSFSATSATFRYEIYKFNSDAKIFTTPPVYISSYFQYSAISATTIVTDTVPVSTLQLDGEYLIKGYYNFNVCTDFLGKLGKTIDTRVYMSGQEYGIYDKNLDFSFIAIKSADIPVLLQSSSNIPDSSKLFQQVILPNSGLTTVVITNGISGQFVLTLNGLVLSNYLDYTYTGNVVTLNSETVIGDIITVIYNTAGGNNLTADVINIETPILSGSTDNQGSNSVYFNTTTNKFEVFTVVTPQNGGSIILMINGATLADGVDYYQSSSNPNRIILEGNLLLNDIVTIVYYPQVNVINGLITNNPMIAWTINTPPQTLNGYFTIEVSNNTTFDTLYTSATTAYIVGQVIYNANFTVNGEIGTKLYYRVKNVKGFTSICGYNIGTTAYSQTVPIVVQTNAINNY
jgi:hypothetical protein